MADFDFKVGFDASDVVSGSQKSEQSLGGLEAAFEKLISVSERINSLGETLSHFGDGAEEIGKKIADGINAGLTDTEKKFKHTKEESEGFFGSLKEKFGEVGGLLVGGGLFTAGAFGLEKIIEKGKEATKSQQDYRTALLQAGTAQGDLRAEQEKGEKVVAAVSDKYNSSKEAIRGLLTEIQGLGAISTDEAKKVAEIGVAFEQVGIPAKTFRAVISGASDPESLAGLDAVKNRFPALAEVIDGAGTSGEKINAIFKGVGPTLQGVADEVNTPAGQFERLEKIGGQVEEAFGQTFIAALEPIVPVVTEIATVLTENVIPAIEGLSHFIGENKTVIAVAVGSFVALRGAMAIQEAGGLVKSLQNVGASALEAGKNIIEKLLPGIFGKTAADAASAGAKTAETVAEVGNTVATGANIVAKEAQVVAEEAAAVASEGLGVAMSAALGPIGLVIAAIGIGATLFAAFSGGTKDLAESTKAAGAAADEFNKATEEAKGVDDQTVKVQGLADEYDKLSKSKLPEDQKRLEEVTKELAAAVPSAADKLDTLDASGKKVGETFKISTDDVRAFTAEQKAMADEKAKETLERMSDKAKQLAQSLHATTEEQKKLRSERDALVKAEEAGFKGAAVASGFLGLGRDDIKDVRDKLGEVNKKLDEAEPEIQKLIKAYSDQGASVEEIAKKTGLTTEEVNKYGGAVLAAKKGIDDSVDSAAKLAAEFNKAKKEADELANQDVAALAKHIKDQLVLKQQEKDGDISHTEALEQQKKIQEDINGLIADKTDDIKDKQQNDEALKIAEKKFGLTKEEKKAQFDLIGLIEARNKVAQLSLEVNLLEHDAGKLSEVSKKQLLESEKSGLLLVQAQVETEIAKLKARTQTHEIEKKLLDAEAKSLENQKRLLEIEHQKVDETNKLHDAYLKLIDGINQTEVSFLNALAAADEFNTKAKFDALNTNIAGTTANVKFLVEELGKKPNASPLLDALNDILTTEGAIKDGVDLTKFVEEFTNKTKELNAALEKSGVQPDQLVDSKAFLDALQKQFAARLALTKANLSEEQKIEQQHALEINNITSAREILITESGISELDQLRLRIAAEKDQYDQLKKAAIDAHDTKAIEKLDADYSAKKLKNDADLFKAEKKAYEEQQRAIKETLGAGFTAAFSVANKAFFDPIDKAIHASDNVFGAFASGIIHHLVEMGEQFIAQQVESLAASLISSAAVTAAMEGITLAAAPAAFAVSVATLGGADVTALASLASSFAAFQGILKLEQGTVVSSPTLALIGEKFEEELVLPMKTAKEFLAEASKGSGGGGISKDDLFDAMDSAFKANPTRGQISGYDIHLVNDAQAKRIKRRGGRS